MQMTWHAAGKDTIGGQGVHATTRRMHMMISAKVEVCMHPVHILQQAISCSTFSPVPRKGRMELHVAFSRFSSGMLLVLQRSP